MPGIGDRHVHHHGLLAGLGAGTAAVLIVGGLVFGVWHRVSGTVAAAVTVIVWALMAAVLAAVAYVLWFLFLRARHHLAHPETLTRHAVRAEVVPQALPPAEAPALPAPLAALPSPVTNHWHLPQDADAAAAVIRSIAEGRQDDDPD